MYNLIGTLIEQVLKELFTIGRYLKHYICCKGLFPGYIPKTINDKETVSYLYHTFLYEIYKKTRGIDNPTKSCTKKNQIETALSKATWEKFSQFLNRNNFTCFRKLFEDVQKMLIPQF